MKKKTRKMSTSLTLNDTFIFILFFAFEDEFQPLMVL